MFSSPLPHTIRDCGLAATGVSLRIIALENTKTTIDMERTRLQTQMHDMERDALQLQHELRFKQDELQKCHENNAQTQNEKKELQAKVLNETEERERIQLQLHQMREQVCTKLHAQFAIRVFSGHKSTFHCR